MSNEIEPIEVTSGRHMVLPAGTAIAQMPLPIHPDRAIVLEIADIFSRPRSREVNGHIVEYFDMEPGLAKRIEDQLREISTRTPHQWD